MSDIIMGGFTKLFSRILTSSIWSESNEVRILWITLLAATGHDGIARVTVPGLSRLANIPISETVKALEVLMAPDPYSRTVEHEGRRVREERDEAGNLYGYYVFNYMKHRAVDATAAERQRKTRARRERDGALLSRKTEDRRQITENVRTEAQTDSPPDPRPEHERIRGSNFREAADLDVQILRAVRQISERTGKPAWEVCRHITSYKRKDGEMSAGVEDPARLGSVLARQKALEDAKWWLEDLEKGKANGEG